MSKSRDYYKILGVRESATEEEIRERWIKLNKRLHPDQEAKGGINDERLREINEAYHMLKHSSTRVQYDLKKAYDSKKEKVSLRRRVILAAISILFLISGFIYFWMSQTDQGSGIEFPRSIFSPETGERTMSEGGYVSRARPEVEISEPKKPAKPERAVSQEERGPIEGRPISREHRDREIPGETTPVASDRRNDATIQRPGRSVTHDELRGTSKEVRAFLSKYAERYVEKDIEGFLSLFSSLAVLNQKEGLEGIRKIYTHFFNESKELRYRLKDPMVEMNQIGLEVKAGFEVDQVLRKEGEKKIWRGQIRWLLSREHDALKIVVLDYQYQ